MYDDSLDMLSSGGSRKLSKLYTTVYYVFLAHQTDLKQPMTEPITDVFLASAVAIMLS